MERTNRVATRRRSGTIWSVVCCWALTCGLVLTTGCGGKDEPTPAEETHSEAMVPAEFDSAGRDTAGMVRDASATQTEPAAAGMVGESDVGAGGKAPDGPAANVERAPSAVTEPSPLPTGTAAGFSLQLGSYASAANAHAQVERLAALGHQAVIEVATLGGQTYHRVVLRGLADRGEAERLGEEIRAQLGITYLIRQR